MEILRKLALIFSCILFGLLLLLCAWDIGFVRTATNPAGVKRTVAQSGIYNSVVPSVLAQQKTISTSLGVIPTNNPIIQHAAYAALPPPFIQQNTEAIIDNIYQWLNGQIAIPNFNVTLSGARVLFANNIADSIQSRLAALPACQNFQQSLNFNVLHAVCRPPGLSPPVVAVQVKNSLLKEEGFLDKTVLSANDLKLNSLQGGTAVNSNRDNQPLFERSNTNRVPQLYRWLKQAPWVLVPLCILAGMAVFVLSASRRKGLRLIGVILLSAGIIMIIFSWGLNKVISQKAIPHIKASTVLLQTDIRKVALDLEQQIDKNYWYAAGIYSVLGTAAIGVTMNDRRGLTANTRTKAPHQRER